MGMTQAPIIAARKPFYKELKAGQRVMWCACGRSQRQPYCDGRSHLGTGIEPVEYRAPCDQEVLFCGCKQTCDAPMCDGTHSNLPGGYGEAEGAGDAMLVMPDEAGVARLDGACFVVSPGTLGSAERYRCRTLVSPELGAEHQSQYLIELAGGAAPILSPPAGDAILWVRAGTGRIAIGDRDFAINGPLGLLVRRGERFRLTAGAAPLSVYASICPAGPLVECDAMDDTFDAAVPERRAPIDENARKAMGPRYFQVLLDDRDGLDNSAQFIGHIPRSRAEMHRHLYEEALIILSGTGTIWNETRRANVAAGDVIFFPRKHVHSLESTSAEGMDVVGLIHPGTNPGINY